MNMSKLQEFDYLLKIVLIGDAAVGKSSLLLRYIDDYFEDTYICTIGVDFKIKSLEMQGKRVKLQIWDTAGQERFKPITNCYFRGSHGCVAVYDITNRETFNNVRTWVQDYREHNSIESGQNIVLIGNKKDSGERVVSFEEGQDLADSFEAEFLECSAKSGDGVSQLFETIARVIVTKMKHELLVAKDPSAYSIKTRPVQSESNPPKKKGCCS